ncbi:MAG: ABC transporter ATP-binding protein [Planctomycetota bacterium]
MSRAVTVTDLEFARPRFALGPLGFDLPAGGRLAVVGPSGSGKTTLLRCLCGLERPTRGRIAIGDVTVTGAGRAVPPNERGLGVVFQDGGLWAHMTALQHLRFAAPGLDDAGAQALLDRVGLRDLARRKPTAMSGGEAQRLGLARALAAEPQVLLLDEPLRSVDVHQRDALVVLLRELCDERGLTTILVTHDRDEALALADQMLVLRAGRVVERGAAADLLTAPRTAFTAAFLGGAACLPVTPGQNGTVGTPFGPVAREGTHDATGLRLVLLPGDVRVDTGGGSSPGTSHSTSPVGRVVAAVPGPHGVLVRVALGDQIVPALADSVLPVGTPAPLRLLRAPRLLPWSLEGDPA